MRRNDDSGRRCAFRDLWIDPAAVGHDRHPCGGLASEECHGRGAKPTPKLRAHAGQHGRLFVSSLAEVKNVDDVVQQRVGRSSVRCTARLYGHEERQRFEACGSHMPRDDFVGSGSRSHQILEQRASGAHDRRQAGSGQLVESCQQAGHGRSATAPTARLGDQQTRADPAQRVACGVRGAEALASLALYRVEVADREVRERRGVCGPGHERPVSDGSRAIDCFAGGGESLSDVARADGSARGRDGRIRDHAMVFR